MIFVIFLFLCLPLPAATPAVDDVFYRLYNYEFEASVSAADAYIAAQPNDPMGHTARASAFLFSELHRLNLLGKEFMTSDDRIKTKEKLIPKDTAQREFARSISETRRLAGNRTDADSLLALTIAAGL